jgi:hypothetical protein
MTTPTTNIGGERQHILHETQMLPLPSQTPFGNLGLKWMKIVSRLIRLNRMILEAYHLHSLAASSTQHVTPSPIEELPHFLEEIVYWLRKTADELIGLSFLCEAYICSGSLPNKVDIDSIGVLLNGGYSVLQTQFASHLDHLRQLNDISNAYKHSFINSDLNFIGRDEPVLFALTLQRNDLSKREAEAFVVIALSEVVRCFNAFSKQPRAIFKHGQQMPN